jgi:hypothetical protein
MRPAQGGFVRCTSFLLTRLRAQSQPSLHHILFLRQSYASARHQAIPVIACQPAEAGNGISQSVLLLTANHEGAGAPVSLGKRSVSEVLDSAVAAEQVQTRVACKLAHLHRLPVVAACQVVVLGRWCPTSSAPVWWQAGWAFELTSGTINPVGSRCSCTASRQQLHASTEAPWHVSARSKFCLHAARGCRFYRCEVVHVADRLSCRPTESLHTRSRSTGSRRRRMSWRSCATSRRCGAGCAAAAL